MSRPQPRLPPSVLLSASRLLCVLRLCTPSAQACTATSFCLSEVALPSHTHVRWMPSCVAPLVPQAVCTYSFWFSGVRCEDHVPRGCSFLEFVAETVLRSGRSNTPRLPHSTGSLLVSRHLTGSRFAVPFAGPVFEHCPSDSGSVCRRSTPRARCWVCPLRNSPASRDRVVYCDRPLHRLSRSLMLGAVCCSCVGVYLCAHFVVSLGKSG